MIAMATLFAGLRRETADLICAQSRAGQTGLDGSLDSCRQVSG